MIKNFKKFRLLTESSTSDDLIEQFDGDYIEKYYDKHHDVDLSEVISMSSHQNIMDCFDDNQYKEDWIRDYTNSYDFSDFDKDDLKSYIKKNLDEEKQNKILEIYNKNNYDEDDEDSEKETEFNYYMLDELDIDELQEVIDDSGEESNCAEWIIEGWYSGQDGEEIFDEFCGWAKKDGTYGSEYYEYSRYGSPERIESSELYKRISDYIDDDKLKQNWKDNEDYEYKKESVANDISYSPALQKYLIKKDPDNAEALIDLWRENNFKGKNIGGEYKFQKAYINKYIKDNIEDEEDEEYKTTLIEDALDFLHKKFGVNDEIAEKYEPYMWKIVAQYKYNL